MGERTAISWCDHTFNPWVGCMAISAACDHCYAETLVKRWGGDFSVRRRTGAANWRQPLLWNKKAEREGRRHRVFCASLSDVFDNQVPPAWRDDLWALIVCTPWLDWLLLTKRPQNIPKMLPGASFEHRLDRDALWGNGWPNVWLGITVEDQLQADIRINVLRAVPAAVRFLSCEPLLEAITPDLTGIHWVIAGGESGSSARIMEPRWPRKLRDQCQAEGVAYWFKQWGKQAPGDELDGRQHHDFPATKAA